MCFFIQHRTTFHRGTAKTKATKLLKEFKKPQVYKPFGFLLVILSLLELSGFAVLSVYSVTLLEVKIRRHYPNSVL